MPGWTAINADSRLGEAPQKNTLAGKEHSSPQRNKASHPEDADNGNNTAIFRFNAAAEYRLDQEDDGEIDEHWADTETLNYTSLRRAFLGSKILEHIDDLPVACKLFNHELKAFGTDAKLRLNGFSTCPSDPMRAPATKPWVKQVVGVISIARKFLSNARSCILADKMGGGKTLQTYTFLWFMWRLVEKKEELAADLAKPAGQRKHLLEGNFNDDIIELDRDAGVPTAQCPAQSGARGDLICPCPSLSPLREFMPLLKYGYGVSVIIVKPDWIRLWVREWDSIWAEREDGMRLVVAHSASAKDYPQYSLQQVKQDAMTKQAFLWSQNRTLTTGCTGRPENNRIVVLTTEKSFETEFIDEMKYGPDRRCYGARVATFVIDEAHMYKGDTSKPWHLIREGKTICPGDAYVLALSGTAIENGPGYLHAMSRAVEERRPADKTAPIHPSSAEIRELGAQWNKVVRLRATDTPEITAVIEKTKEIARDWMVRRTEKTDFGGGPCLRVPELKIHIQQVQHDLEVQLELDERAKKDTAAILETNRKRAAAGLPGLAYNGVMARHASRVCANYPALRNCRKVDSSGRQVARSFTAKELKDESITRGDEEDSYLWTGLKEIFETSAKADLLQKWWDGNLDGLPGIKESTDWQGEPSRAVFVSSLAPCVQILRLITIKYLGVPEHQIAFVPAGCNKKLRASELLRFNTRADQINKPGFASSTARILIAHSKIIDHALNLVTAEFIFINEPDFMRATQEQLVHRSVRPSNPNATVTTVVGIANDITEELIVKRQEARAQIEDALNEQAYRPSALRTTLAAIGVKQEDATNLDIGDLDNPIDLESAFSHAGLSRDEELNRLGSDKEAERLTNEYSLAVLPRRQRRMLFRKGDTYDEE